MTAVAEVRPLEDGAEIPMPATGATPLEIALSDLRSTLLHPRFWISLAWIDIIQRYRGSIIGPFWLTISTGIFILGLGPLYGQLFSVDLPHYLPYLTAGIVVWTFISTMIIESCRTYIDAGNIMKQLRLPRSLHLFHLLARNIIIFAHSIPLYILVALVLHVPLTPMMLLAIPGYLVVCANLLILGSVLAIICVRFRDFIQIVASVLQLLFFVTPIFWQPGDRPMLRMVSDWNPMSAMIAMVRNPLLNELPTLPQLLLVAVWFIAGAALSFWLFVRYRQRIVYWV